MNRFLFVCTLGACVAASLTAPARAATSVSLSIADARLVEPPSGQKSIIFPVTLSRVWSEDVRVSYATSVGPNTSSADSSTLAQPGFDFSTRQGQITIPAGTTRTQIEVPVLADSQIEKDETFSVSLSNLSGSDNFGNSVVLGRSLAKGIIVEPVKGTVLGGKVVTYDVTPYATYNPITGTLTDKFDSPAQPTNQSNVSIFVSGQNIARNVLTDALGNFSLLVLPGTYSVETQSFSRPDFSGNAQTYSLPARSISVLRDSRANTFAFYGVAGTIGVPSGGRNSEVYGAYVQVEARPVGADPASAPVATTIANYFDQRQISRGYRFFLPALPQGRYTLSITDVDGYNFYNAYYNFPTVTVSLPDNTGVNRPDAHVEILGSLKTSSQGSRASSSASGS